MSAKALNDLNQLCVHTITTKPWSIEEAAIQYSKAGVKGISVWRDALHNRSIRGVATMLKEHDLKVVSLCRGGFFPAKDLQKRINQIDENKRAIEEAHELGAPLVVLVCGAEPGQSLEDSRKQIRDGIEAVVGDAAAAGVRLAIEPLHPMYADTRSAINTLAQANVLAEVINSPTVGVAVDVYHVWWDPTLEFEIKRAGENRQLFAFHICDWNVPTTDMLNDRGIMGEGCIPLNRIRSWVEEAGFEGFYEVEIFSNKYWQQDQSQFLKKIIKAYKENS